MSLFFLSNATLEIVAGVAWWTLHKTYNGIYYIIYGNDTEIKLDENEVHTELLETLIKKSETQQLEIKQLTTHINVLSDYIKNNAESNNRESG